MSAADCEAKLVIHQLIETMQEFVKEWDSLYIGKDMFNEDDIDHEEEESLKKRLDEISIHISSLLPKDPNLSEVNDLFMPSTNHDTLSGIQYSGESMTLFLENSLKFYRCIMTINILTFHRVSLDPVHISTFTELTMLLPCTETDIYTIHRNIAHLLWFTRNLEWKIADVWLALKVLRVLFIKCKEYVEISRFDNLRKRIQWLMKLKDIPQAKSKEKQRLTSWISRQAASILECLDCSFIYNDKHNFSLWTGDHETYVYNLMQHNEPSVEVLDYLHIYFMSSSDENQRVQLIKSFIRGCLRAYENDISHLYEQLHEQKCYNLPEEVLFLKYFEKLTKEFLNYIMNYFIYCNLEKFIKKWNELEKYYCNKFEPYLVENRNNSCVLDDSSCQRINDKSKNALEAENMEEPPDDLVIEKYIIFDEFLNRLHVLSILREALWKTADVLEMDQFPEYYETMIFRTSSLSSLKSDFQIRSSGWHCYYCRALTYVAMKICPFLFLSKHQEYLIEDLCKFFNGEVVDEASLDELYFAINCTPAWFELK